MFLCGGKFVFQKACAVSVFLTALLILSNLSRCF